MRKHLLIALTVALVVTSCKKEKSEPLLPELTFSGTEIIEGNTGTKMASINFTLSKVSAKDVTFTVFTKDATAKEGIDYTGLAATEITIAAGETSKVVNITTTTDTDMELNKYFELQTENATNAVLKNSSAKITIRDDDTYTPETVADGYITPATYNGMDLVWSDEFNGTQLNSEFWKFDLGGNGWGNNELETYTNSENNVFVQNGYLNIKAIKDGNSYTSGRILTSGKKEFKYGRIDIRAKLPNGKGIWPALWMLGSNISTVNWPACGEIDIMELLGHEPNKVYGTIHWDEGGHKSSGSSYVLPSGDFSQNFHIYTLFWQEGSMTVYVDYQKVCQYTFSGNTFNSKFFFIMNVAVGGSWPGNPDNTTIFPQTMLVDYIRVFQ